MKTKKRDKTIAIHQPNFFPWLGYFNKIVRSDAFILLDNVQLQKTGGTWSNRVKLCVSGEARWVTAPIDRSYHGVRNISEMEFNESIPWREKMVKTLEANYRKAPFFGEVFPFIENLVLNPEANLARYNIEAIRSIAMLLGIDTEKLVLGSSLEVDGHATDLLICMTKAVGGSAYMCGGGAEGYQQDASFAEAGLDLVYQDFQQPVYQQAGPTEFVSGLSILDALMNLGKDGVRSLLLKI
ncbi:MAG TPA: WbqC family protein [Methylobacter sp.]|jgi:hypothetical protein